MRWSPTSTSVTPLPGTLPPAADSTRPRARSTTRRPARQPGQRQTRSHQWPGRRSSKARARRRWLGRLALAWRAPRRRSGATCLAPGSRGPPCRRPPHRRVCAHAGSGGRAQRNSPGRPVCLLTHRLAGPPPRAGHMNLNPSPTRLQYRIFAPRAWSWRRKCATGALLAGLLVAIQVLAIPLLVFGLRSSTHKGGRTARLTSVVQGWRRARLTRFWAGSRLTFGGVSSPLPRAPIPLRDRRRPISHHGRKHGMKLRSCEKGCARLWLALSF